MSLVGRRVYPESQQRRPWRQKEGSRVSMDQAIKPWKRVALIFPGQGSQHVGMGERLSKVSKAAKHLQARRRSARHADFAPLLRRRGRRARNDHQPAAGNVRHLDRVAGRPPGALGGARPPARALRRRRPFDGRVHCRGCRRFAQLRAGRVAGEGARRAHGPGGPGVPRGHGLDPGPERRAGCRDLRDRGGGRLRRPRHRQLRGPETSSPAPSSRSSCAMELAELARARSRRPSSHHHRPPIPP